MSELNLKNEISRIKLHYFSSPGAQCHYWNSNESEVCNLFAALQKAQDGNMPDGYAVHQNSIYLFEHFEFDAYPRTKSGSKYKKGDIEIQRRFLRENQEDPSKKSLHTAVPGKPSMQHYMKNAQEIFSKHLRQVPTYKKNIRELLKNDDMETKVIFIIEDTTTLGSILQDGRQVILPECDFFIELFEQQDEVDGILCIASGSHGKSIVSYMDKASIPTLRMNMIQTSNVELIPWNTMVMHRIFEIPNDN